MKDRFENQVIVEGYVFDHTLQHRVTGENSKNPGTDFINGNISIATDEDKTNIVTVKFNYVTSTYKNGNPNRTYQTLDQIINAGAKASEVDLGMATKVKVTGAIDTNDFLGRDGEMVAARQITGSFCDIVQVLNADEAKRATFKADYLVYGTKEHEVEDGDDYLELNGYCFNFRGDLLPINLSVVNPGGISWFEDQEPSVNNPLLCRVWGDIVSTIIKKETVTESAWGEAQVDVSTRTITAWNITGCNTDCGEFDDDSTITKDELEKAKNARVEYVASEKARQEEYRNSQQGNAGFPSTKGDSKSSSPTASADYVF